MSKSPRTSRGDREMSASADFATALNFERKQASPREASLSLAAIDSNARPRIARTGSKEFSPFRPDAVNQCLWRRRKAGDEERILLKPKAFAFLLYLVDHAGGLVTQEELLEAVWLDTYVQPEVLKRHIFEIRNLLGR